MNVTDDMVKAGLEVFEEYLEWHNYPYTNAQLVEAILRAAGRLYNPSPAASPRTSRAIRCSKKTTSGFVYFLKCGDKIKIGKAEDVRKRMAGIQTSSPDIVECLGVTTGGVREERRLHKKFSHLRHHGEWFVDATEIREFINKNCDSLNDNKKGRSSTKNVQLSVGRPANI